MAPGCHRLHRAFVACGRQPAPRVTAPPRQQYLDLRAQVHRKLLNRLNLEALAQAERARAESEIRTLLGQLLAEENTPLSLPSARRCSASCSTTCSASDRSSRCCATRRSATSWSTRYKHVFVERGGVLERVPTTFQDDRHLLRIIDRIVSAVGRRIDDSSPMVDARLPDGSRVNAIIPPLALDGPLLSIRRFPADRLKAEDLVALRVADAADARLPGGTACARG